MLFCVGFAPLLESGPAPETRDALRARVIFAAARVFFDPLISGGRCVTTDSLLLDLNLCSRVHRQISLNQRDPPLQHLHSPSTVDCREETDW